MMNLIVFQFTTFKFIIVLILALRLPVEWLVFFSISGIIKSSWIHKKKVAFSKVLEPS